MEGGSLWRLASMTEFSKLVLFAAVASLTFGLPWPDPELAGGRAPFPQDYLVLTANETTQQSQVQSEDNAEESAKMGKESGTQSGDDATTPEAETKKVDQPPNQNPTSGN
jgi:hypothetical protein